MLFLLVFTLIFNIFSVLVSVSVLMLVRRLSNQIDVFRYWIEQKPEPEPQPSNRTGIVVNEILYPRTENWGENLWNRNQSRNRYHHLIRYRMRFYIHDIRRNGKQPGGRICEAEASSREVWYHENREKYGWRASTNTNHITCEIPEIVAPTTKKSRQNKTERSTTRSGTGIVPRTTGSTSESLVRVGKTVAMAGTERNPRYRYWSIENAGNETGAQPRPQ